MRNLTFIFITLGLFVGCSAERAQAGADARAGLNAAQAAMAAGAVTADVVGILSGVDKYLPAATGVNSAEWPAPTKTASAIVADIPAYASAAPAEPPAGTPWAVLGAIGLGALGLVRVIAPMIPGGGPLVKVVADAAWAVMAHKDQKATDKAQEQISEAVAVAMPVVAALQAMPPEDLPPAIKNALDNPLVKQALDLLAASKPAARAGA